MTKTIIASLSLSILLNNSNIEVNDYKMINGKFGDNLEFEVNEKYNNYDRIIDIYYNEKVEDESITIFINEKNKDFLILNN